MKFACADTGFFIGLYDETDAFHQLANLYFEELFENGDNHLVVPWPVLYETVSTKLVKHRSRLEGLRKDWIRLTRERRLVLIPDEQYRDGLADECFDELRRLPGQYRNLSAVDRVIRRMLLDPKLRISVFVTCNSKDFHDVCSKRRTDLYGE